MSAIEKARGELKRWVRDMAALKAWVDLGNPESQPFADAYAAALRKALAAATAYATAASADAAPGELGVWLDDMATLRPHVDGGNPKSAPFGAAFTAARTKALAAAEAYAKSNG